ncbi:MAG: PfkB family carbohydrate kinase [Chloroflexota bacterium]|nr:PfkB family carbohydrate kinase [Chloroflexota bacterium]
MPSPDFLAIGSIIIDDIVYPDGRTSMGVLGGGGAHAAYGIAFAGEKPALVGVVGEDLPADIRARLEADFDTAGLVWTHHPQMRGWQIFEWNGLRNEIFRVEVIEPFMYGPAADSPHVPFERATGFTLLRAPEHVAGWRARFPDAMLLWEPVRVFMLSADREAFLKGIAQADIVSPNLHEAQTMYGVEDELEIMRRMLDDGVNAAALRMGELGSLVARGGDAVAHYIPAVEVAEVVDQTGAGNSYCGGFLVGYCRERDIVAASCYGAAAASFTLEHVGCARIPADLDAEWERRLEEARRGVRTVAL